MIRGVGDERIVAIARAAYRRRCRCRSRRNLRSSEKEERDSLRRNDPSGKEQNSPKEPKGADDEEQTVKE